MAAPAVADHDPRRYQPLERGCPGHAGAAASEPHARKARHLLADHRDQEEPIRPGDVALTMRPGIRQRDAVALADDRGDTHGSRLPPPGG